ncbi:MAG: hypothetical protein NZ959_11380 [Armatimonadetes bacterium]|nr:hypothetical protein [Armatimonadota bacterium]MDW8122937.1 DUF6785 family protein [Armatimonadota bacterium]
MVKLLHSMVAAEPKVLAIASRQQAKVSFVVVVLLVFFIPISAYWMARRGQDGIMSLGTAPVVLTFFVGLLNCPFARWWRRWALSPSDLALIWAVLAVTTGIATEWGEGPGLVGFPVWFSNPVNRYDETILPHLPSWMVNTYRDALDAFYGGHRAWDLYRPDHLQSWLVPTLGWCGLISVLLALMLGLLIVLSPRWLEQERLSYPIATVPRLLSEGGCAWGLINRGRFWLGFLLGVLYDGGFGLAFWWRGQMFQAWKGLDLSTLIISRPWNVIGWTPIPALPFMAALSYFIPADMAFSGVFFFVFRKAQQIIAAALGHDVVPLWGGMAGAARVPYLTEQSAGALIALFAVYLWHTRDYLLSGLGANLRADQWRSLIRFAVALFFVGAVGVLLYVLTFRDSVPFFLLYLALFIAISTAISKIRAQIGPPIHEFAFMGVHRWFVDLFGAKRLGDRAITLMGYLYFTHRIWRTHPMPQMTDGFKVVYDRGGLGMPFIVLMLLAILYGSLSMFWAHLQAGYIWGRGAPWGYGAWIMEWRQMADPNYTAAAFGVGAALFTLFLVFVHNRFPFLPFHPAGYALAMNFGIDYCWFPMLLAGLFKVAILRYLGQKAYHSLVPFAVGVILGQYCTGSVWSWIFILTGKPTYSFSIN